MAGKFLSLEEVARHLGVTVDEVNRLVDRKKLFPMRDGATVKFKLEEVERVAGDLADEASSAASGGDLGLDLDLASDAGASPAGEEISLGDAIEETESIFGSGIAGGNQPSQTIVRGGGDDLAGSALAGSDLDLGSIIGTSSPSLAGGPAKAPPGSGSLVTGSAPLTLDLGNVGSGSLAMGSGPAAGSAPSLAGPLDSGLSLEEKDLEGSGLDLGSSIAASGIDLAGTSLTGEAFDLGDATEEEESASVVIATEETGDSSFFGTVSDDSGSVSLEDSAIAGVVVGDDSYGETIPAGPPFSALQITGLVCCTLFLLTCGLVMIDLVWAIRAPGGAPIASPLLKALTETFAWR